MKLVSTKQNTKSLTLQQCIDIIEKSSFQKKDRVIRITNNIYNMLGQYVRSIFLDDSSCTWEWCSQNRQYNMIISRCWMEDGTLRVPLLFALRPMIQKEIE
jgi:hypothetical protein